MTEYMTEQMIPATIDRRVVHATIVAERVYAAAPARVFAAWADPVAYARWHVPGDDWVIAESVHDFRVGGRDYIRFGPEGQATLHSEGRFEDIVPNERIVSAGTMHDDGTRISSTLCTVELLADGDGTRLILTDQSAFLDGRETPTDRDSGWKQVLDRLTAELQRAAE